MRMKNLRILAALLCVMGSSSANIGGITPLDQNHPPLPVITLTGTTMSLYPGASYHYEASTTDPDGDRIQYTFDWGDGCSSTTYFIPSGAISKFNPHAWKSPGIYAVRVRATDSHDGQSAWSAPLMVRVSQFGPWDHGIIEPA